MLSSLLAQLPDLIATYGYWLLALVVALESTGVPVPGETALVGAAVYAGLSSDLEIGWVIAAAAVGAIIGDNVGYILGSRVGESTLERYGGYVGLTPAKIALGRHLFLTHGGKIVFWGRFVAFLRVFAAVLAGANGMAWTRFLAFNAAGGLAWTALMGLGGYTLGAQFHEVAGAIGLVGLGLAVVAMIGLFLVMRRFEARILARAAATPPPAPPA